MRARVREMWRSMSAMLLTLAGGVAAQITSMSLPPPSAPPDGTRPVRCESIFDNNTWIPFVGGKAKGVVLTDYMQTIHFIGCRGDANGNRVTTYVKSKPYSTAPATTKGLFVQPCAPESFFCEDSVTVNNGGTRTCETRPSPLTRSLNASLGARSALDARLPSLKTICA